MKQLVLIGAGHTHIHILRNAETLTQSGARITIVTPETGHPYSGMGPGLLGGSYRWEEICIPVQEQAARAGVSFLRASARSVDPDARVLTLGDGRRLEYDVLSINIGSDVAPTASLQDHRVYRVKPIANLARLKSDLIAARSATFGDAAHLQTTTYSQTATQRRTTRVAVIGGGPAGVECAGNIAYLLHTHGIEASEVTLYSRSETLGRMTPERSRWIETFLQSHRVAVRREVVTSSDDIDADFVVLASGTHPPETLRDFGLPLGPGGGLAVNDYLQSVDHANVFAVGDCADFVREPLDRVGVYAVRMQPLLFDNVHALLREQTEEIRRFTRTGPYLAGVNLGFGQGLLYRGRWDLRGRAAFRLKDFIDRRFMKRYLL
ncbi:MAG: hypothetical protein EA383_03005 [Spirochaetaceae bacterium]|nr:MAG: hypothetical protein EA383_03005 [Spirochaetaceae bacterium]